VEVRQRGGLPDETEEDPMPKHASPPGRHASRATLVVAALIAAAVLCSPLLVAPAPATAPALSTAGVCAGAVQHPLAIHVDALDPIRRGAAVRLRVTTRTARGFERGTVRMTSSGGAAVAGASSAGLRAVPAGGQAASEFLVEVPARGQRFLIQFRVETEGEDGLSARGASFNLLPDGPAEQGREGAAATGEKLYEVSARRIGR
jgi:hypothetical protein